MDQVLIIEKHYFENCAVSRCIMRIGATRKFYSAEVLPWLHGLLTYEANAVSVITKDSLFMKVYALVAQL